MKTLLAKLLARYLVVAQFDDKTAHHYAKDWDEALEWIRCYASKDACAVYERSFGVTAVVPVASRFAA